MLLWIVWRAVTAADSLWDPLLLWIQSGSLYLLLWPSSSNLKATGLAFNHKLPSRQNLTNVIRYFWLLLVGRRILPITIIFMDCHLVPKFPRLCILPLPGDISCSQWMLMLGVDILSEINFHSVPFKSPSQMKEKLFPCVFKLQPRGNKTVFPLSRHEWGRKSNW